MIYSIIEGVCVVSLISLYALRWRHLFLWNASSLVAQREALSGHAASWQRQLMKRLQTWILVASTCGISASCAPSRPSDFCPSSGRSLSSTERKIGAINYVISSDQMTKPLRREIYTFRQILLKYKKSHDHTNLALDYLHEHPTCCSIEKPWPLSIQNGLKRNEALDDLFRFTSKDFGWIYDVNIQFLDSHGRLTKFDLATDVCGKFKITSRG